LARCKGLTEQGLVCMARALGPTIKLLDFQGLKPVGNEPLGRYAIRVLVCVGTEKMNSSHMLACACVWAPRRRTALTCSRVRVFGHRADETTSHKLIRHPYPCV
jgi:hypothetical protein